MKKERIMIMKMEKNGAFIDVYAYSMNDGKGFVQSCFCSESEIVSYLRKVFTIAKGSVMHV